MKIKHKTGSKTEGKKIRNPEATTTATECNQQANLLPAEIALSWEHKKKIKMKQHKEQENNRNHAKQVCWDMLKFLPCGCITTQVDFTYSLPSF